MSFEVLAAVQAAGVLVLYRCPQIPSQCQCLTHRIIPDHHVCQLYWLVALHVSAHSTQTDLVLLGLCCFFHERLDVIQGHLQQQYSTVQPHTVHLFNTNKGGHSNI